MENRPIAAIIALGCLITSANAGLTGLLDLSGRDVAGLGLGAGESGGYFDSPKTFDAVSDLSLNNVAWSDGGYSGEIDISFVATSSEGYQIVRGGKGAFGVDAGAAAKYAALIRADEGTISLSGIQFTYVSGDALSKIESIEFAAVYIGNWTSGETGTLNADSITTGDSGGDTSAAGMNVLGTFADSVVVDSTNGGFSINGVDLNVTAIPEPATLGLVTGFGGAVLLIRRRFMI